MMSTHSPIIKRWSKRTLVIMTILVVGLIPLGFLVIAPPRAETQAAPIVTKNDNSIQRSLDASAARYTALAEYYIAETEGRQRGLEASTARYTAMAAYYNAKNDTLQRGLEASAARYTAMAEFYGAENTNLQRGLDAAAARYSALAQHYAATTP